MQKPQQFRIYRANKSGSGFASAWELSYKEENKYDPWMCFVNISKQKGNDSNGNATFDWDNGLTVKLGPTDIGELIAVIRRLQKEAGYQGKLYHRTKSGNKVITFSKAEKDGFHFSVSAQDKNKKSSGKYSQVISNGEAMILLTLLEEAVRKIYLWG